MKDAVVKEMVDWTEVKIKRILEKAANPPACMVVMEEVVMELHMQPIGKAMLMAAAIQTILHEQLPILAMAFSIALQKAAVERGN